MIFCSACEQEHNDHIYRVCPHCEQAPSPQKLTETSSRSASTSHPKQQDNPQQFSFDIANIAEFMGFLIVVFGAYLVYAAVTFLWTLVTRMLLEHESLTTVAFRYMWDWRVPSILTAFGITCLIIFLLGLLKISDGKIAIISLIAFGIFLYKPLFPGPYSALYACQSSGGSDTSVTISGDQANALNQLGDALRNIPGQEQKGQALSNAQPGTTTTHQDASCGSFYPWYNDDAVSRGLSPNAGSNSPTDIVANPSGTPLPADTADKTSIPSATAVSINTPSGISTADPWPTARESPIPTDLTWPSGSKLCHHISDTNGAQYYFASGNLRTSCTFTKAFGRALYFGGGSQMPLDLVITDPTTSKKIKMYFAAVSKDQTAPYVFTSDPSVATTEPYTPTTPTYRLDAKDSRSFQQSNFYVVFLQLE